jgi:cytochrome o ubiquinol oxidase operon protein cyoD
MALNAPPLDPGSGTFGGRTAARQKAAATATHGSARSYGLGFLLSAVLTVIPFAMVMTPGMAHSTVMAAVLTSAVAQIVVHMVFFLHMNTHTSENRWNAFTFAFTVLITAIMISGSVWIMHHLTTNMQHRMDNEAVIPQR